jgi:hypothetical protein
VELARAPRRALRAAYRFDEWHTWPVPARPYVTDIAAYLNDRPAAERRSVVEIGSGLGDVLHRLHYERCLGIDQDEAIVRAASFVARLRRDRIQFAVSGFPADRLEGRHDAVVLVNWIHSVPPETLRDWVTDLVDRNLSSRGILVIDVVDGPGYRFHHSPQALAAGLGVDVDEFAAYPDGRRLVALRCV